MSVLPHWGGDVRSPSAILLKMASNCHNLSQFGVFHTKGQEAKCLPGLPLPPVSIDDSSLPGSCAPMINSSNEGSLGQIVNWYF